MIMIMIMIMIMMRYDSGLIAIIIPHHNHNHNKSPNVKHIQVLFVAQLPYTSPTIRLGSSMPVRSQNSIQVNSIATSLFL